MNHTTSTDTSAQQDRFDPWLPDMSERLEQITSALALRIAHYLCRIRRYSDATARVSQARIAEVMGATEEGVRRAIKTLRDAGLLAWDKSHRQVARYRLLYMRPAEAQTDQGSAPTQLQSGVVTQLQSGAIPEGLYSQKKTPPNPRSSRPETAQGSNEQRGRESISHSTTAPPVPVGRRWGRMRADDARTAAATRVPSVANFKALDAVVESTVTSNADGQGVMDWDLHRQIEGRAKAGIPGQVLQGVTMRLIDAQGTPRANPRVLARFAQSVASMGRFGEITPSMLTRAAQRVVAGGSCVEEATDLYRQVMENRYRCRDMQRLLLLQTDGGAHPYTDPNSRQFAPLGDVLPTREVPVGQRVPIAAEPALADRVTA